jgi:metal-responsive CopG/Arc/MetJ family transcriptional regulator
MKTKTSVSLSNEILVQMDNINSDGNRSDFIEKALWRYIELLRREKRNQNDLNIINKASQYLNKEAEDTLLFQVKHETR